MPHVDTTYKTATEHHSHSHCAVMKLNSKVYNLQISVELNIFKVHPDFLDCFFDQIY